jgi:hypothetical protein
MLQVFSCNIIGLDSNCIFVVYCFVLLFKQRQPPP